MKKQQPHELLHNPRFHTGLDERMMIGKWMERGLFTHANAKTELVCVEPLINKQVRK